MNPRYTARSVMHTDLVTVRPTDAIAGAIQSLIEHRISGLPVVDGHRRLLGMVTEKDMLRLLYEEPGTVMTVSDLMTTSLRTFQVDDPLDLVTDCLMANHFRRVPILDGEVLVGIISRADLMEAALELAAERAVGEQGS